MRTFTNQNGSLGDRIRAARENAQLTQSELADRLFQQQATISRWECGRMIPDVMEAQRIARELQVDVQDLLPKQPES